MAGLNGGNYDEVIDAVTIDEESEDECEINRII